MDCIESTNTEVELSDKHHEDNDNIVSNDDASDTSTQDIENSEGPQILCHADLISYALSYQSQIGDDEPINLNESINSKAKDNLYHAMPQEIESLERNQTWKLVPKPKDQRVVGCK